MKLSYANVMSTIAVFVALGGSAFAVQKINGSSIKPHSIPGSKMKRNAVVPQAEVSRTTRQLVISRASKSAKRGTAARASGAGTLVRIQAGESAELLNSGPFQFSASCVDTGGGAVKTLVFAKTTEAGSIETDNTLHGSGTALEPGAPVEVFNDSPHPVASYIAGVGRVSLASPSGETLNIGAINVGAHLFGADCAVSMFGVG